MVLFVYICRLASNEEIKIKIETTKLLVVSSIVLITMFEINKTQQINTTNLIFKIIARTSLTPTILSIFYLLLTLIVVVKITDNKISALRTAKR
jgi:hypothetical protein